MAYIIETPDPFQPLKGLKKHIYHGGGSIRGWLEKDKPGFVEFDHPTICLVNGKPVMRANWGQEIQDDDIVNFVAVVGEVVTWVAIIVAVISIVLSVVMALTAPGAPGETPASDPVFSTKGQTNAIRLGEPIECNYGRNRIFPSLASRPFFQYSGNNQYQHSLFCIGQGFYEIDAIQIGDTPVSSFGEVESEIVFPGNTATLFATNVYTSSEAGGQRLFAPNELEYPAPDGWVGPFSANPVGTLATKIEIDVNYPNGIYATNKKGKVEYAAVVFMVEKQLIDDAGVPLGLWTTFENNVAIYATTTPQRFTLSHEVSSGRYQVRIRRTNASLESTTLQDRVLWEGMRAFLSGNVPDYGNVTLLAIRVKATNNLNSNSAKQFNVVATRKLLMRDESSGDFGTPVATRSIIWAFVDVFRSLYGGRITDDRFFDWDTLYELDALYESRDEHFDWIFRDAITVWDAVKAIGRVGRATPLISGSIITLRRDGPLEVPMALFGPDNIVKGSFDWSIKLWEPEENDSVSVEYTEPATGYKQENVMVTLPGGTTDNPKDVRYAGIQDRNHAYRAGLYLLASDRYLRENISFETGMEGYLPSFGDLIAIAHDVPQWGQSGYIVAVEEETGDVVHLHVSEPLVMDPLLDYQILLRGSKGEVLGPFDVTGTDNLKKITVVIEDEIDYQLGGNTEPMIFLFGVVGSITKYGKIVKIEPQTGERIRITAVNDAPIIHSFDALTAPPLTFPSIPLAVPDLPVITRLFLSRIQGSLHIIQASWFAAFGAQSYVVETSVDNVNWTSRGETPRTSIQLQVSPGLVYVRVAAVNVYQGPWISGSILVGLVSGLAVAPAWTGLDWTVTWWEDLNIDAYLIKIYDNSESEPILKRTVQQTELAFTYTYAMALADGNVNRDMLVTVETMLLDENTDTLVADGIPESLELHNPLPVFPDFEESSGVEDSSGISMVQLNFVGNNSDDTAAIYRVSWNNPPDDDLVRFKIWQSLDPAFDPNVDVPVIDETSSAIGWTHIPTEAFIEIPLDSSGSHADWFVRVALFDVWGEELGTNLSELAGVLNVVDSSSIIGGGLDAPVALDPTSVSDTAFTANWTDVLTATAYLLDVSTDIAFGSFVGAYHDFSIADPTVLENLTGLTTATPYYYRVRATDGVTISDYSNIKSATPLFDMLTIPNIEMLIDADTGCFTDTAKTTPCVDGDLIAAWENQGNGSITTDMLQATSGIRPTWVATGSDGNGKPRVHFSGKMMQIILSLPAPYCIFFVGKFTSAGSAGYATWIWGASSNPQITTPNAYAYGHSAQYVYASFVADGNQQLGGTGNDGPGLVYVTFNNGGTFGIHEVNRVNAGGGGYHPVTLIDPTIGDYSLGGGYGLTGDIYAMGIISRIPDGTEKGNIEQYYKAKFGLD
jgi:Putative phage tail protein